MTPIVASVIDMKRTGQSGDVYAWRSHDGSWRALVLGARTQDGMWGDDIWMARLDLRTPGPPTAADIASSRLLLGDAHPRLAPAIVDGSHVPWWLMPVAVSGTPAPLFAVEELQKSWLEWESVPDELLDFESFEPQPGEVVTIPPSASTVLLGPHLDTCTLSWQSPRLWPNGVIVSGQGLPAGLEGVESLRIDGGGVIDARRIAPLTNLLSLWITDTTVLNVGALCSLRSLRSVTLDFNGYTPTDLPTAQDWSLLLEIDWSTADGHAEEFRHRFPRAFTPRG